MHYCENQSFNCKPTNKKDRIMSVTLIHESLPFYLLCNYVRLPPSVFQKTTSVKDFPLLGIIVGFLFGKLSTSLVCSPSSTLRSASSTNDLPAKSGQPTAVQYSLAKCHELRCLWIRMKRDERIPRLKKGIFLLQE